MPSSPNVERQAHVASGVRRAEMAAPGHEERAQSVTEVTTIWYALVGVGLSVLLALGAFIGVAAKGLELDAHAHGAPSDTAVVIRALAVAAVLMLGGVGIAARTRPAHESFSPSQSVTLPDGALLCVLASYFVWTISLAKHIAPTHHYLLIASVAATLVSCLAMSDVAASTVLLQLVRPTWRIWLIVAAGGVTQFIAVVWLITTGYGTACRPPPSHTRSAQCSWGCSERGCWSVRAAW